MIISDSSACDFVVRTTRPAVARIKTSGKCVFILTHDINVYFNVNHEQETCIYCSYAKSYRTDVLPPLSRAVRMGKRIRFKRYVQRVRKMYVSKRSRTHDTSVCFFSIIEMNKKKIDNNSDRVDRRRRRSVRKRRRVLPEIAVNVSFHYRRLQFNR